MQKTKMTLAALFCVMNLSAFAQTSPNECELSVKTHGKVAVALKADESLYNDQGIEVRGKDIQDLLKNPTNSNAISFLSRLFPKKEWVAYTANGFDRLLKVDAPKVGESSPLFQIANHTSWFEEDFRGGYVNGPSTNSRALFEWVGFEIIRGFGFRIKPNTKIKSIKFKNYSYLSYGTDYTDAKSLIITIENPSGKGTRILILSFMSGSHLGITIQDNPGIFSRTRGFSSFKSKE